MERIIDITKIPALWTTCDKSQDRHEPMESMLKGLGISALKVSGPITTPYTIGVAKGYIEALTNSKPPFIILEDDATLVFDSPDKVFKVPDNSDALRSFIDNPEGGCDDPVAESMWSYNVYSVKKPIFYQKDGRSDDATRLPINILLP